MTSLRDIQQQQGAHFAPDGIPIHFGDESGEYQAALGQAALMDRSHEGRILITGADRLEIMHRISTNALTDMRPNQGRGTVFTNANARIIDRVLVLNRADHALIITEPGRGPAMTQFLQRQIFFNDDAQLADRTASSHQFVLHGPASETIVAALGTDPTTVPDVGGAEATIAGVPVYIARRKPISRAYWSVCLFEPEHAAAVWEAITSTGAPYGLKPSGGIVYNMLRIRAGRPGYGRELSTDYIPLEVGLWDEVSFNKGCYTGQEIIARMESRGRIAKTIVRLQPAASVATPTPIIQNGKAVGTLTSAAQTADGQHYGIAVLKTQAALHPDGLHTEGGVALNAVELTGAQPPQSMLEGS